MFSGILNSYTFSNFIAILTSFRLFKVLRLGLRSTSLKSNLMSFSIWGILQFSISNQMQNNKYLFSLTARLRLQYRFLTRAEPLFWDEKQTALYRYFWVSILKLFRLFLMSRKKLVKFTLRSKTCLYRTCKKKFLSYLSNGVISERKLWLFFVIFFISCFLDTFLEIFGINLNCY